MFIFEKSLIYFAFFYISGYNIFVRIYFLWLLIMELTTTKHEKKGLLIKILKALEPYRDFAEWLLVIIRSVDDEAFIDSILLEIQKWIKSIKSNKKREKIKKELKQINKKNDKQTKQDKKDADRILEDFINNI